MNPLDKPISKDDPHAIFKYDGGRNSLLCHECSRIIRSGSELSIRERFAARGDFNIPPILCNDCKFDKIPEDKILFVDDTKYPIWYGLDPNNILHCKTSFEAMKFIGLCDILYLDYDLDIDQTKGINLIKYFKGKQIFFISLTTTVGAVQKMIDLATSLGIPNKDISSVILDGRLLPDEEE